MGGGSWTTKAFVNYSAATNKIVNSDYTLNYTAMSASQVFKQHDLHEELNPKNVIRECKDTDEHPRTIPVIIGIDVTGSMGPAAKEVASKLNTIISNVMEKVKDAEFMIMGIGDLNYDTVPIQASQFESDVRIARHLDNIYFEGHGGGNDSESYSAAWYFGARKTDLDCWKRGEKGIIITIGDEPLNENLPLVDLSRVVGGHFQGKYLDTQDIYNEAIKKFDIYHIHVLHDSGSEAYKKEALRRFGNVIGKQNVMIAELDENNPNKNVDDALDRIISNIIIERSEKQKKQKKVKPNNVITEKTEKTEDLEEIGW